MPSDGTAAVKARVLKAASVRVAPVIHLTGDDEARAEVERQRQGELDDAYRAGLADGRRQAEADGHAAAARVGVELTELRATIERTAAAQVSADAAAIAGVAMEIARWVVGRELSSDAAAVVTRIEAALTELTPSTGVEVHVAPAAVPAVEAWAGQAADVHADPALAPGEARVVAGASRADLTFAEAFRRAAAMLGIEDGTDA